MKNVQCFCCVGSCIGTFALFLVFAQADARVMDTAKSNVTKLKCESLDYLKCGENHPENLPCIPEILECETPEPGKRAHCFALWKRDNDTNSFVELKKGCWLDDRGCYDRHKCVNSGRPTNGDLNFCCCEGNLCNAHVSYDPNAPLEPEDSLHNYPYGLASSSVDDGDDAGGGGLQILKYTSLSLVAIVVLSLAFWFCRRKKMQPYFDPMPVETAMPPFPSTLKPQIQAAIASNGPFRGGPLFDPLDGENCQDPNAGSPNALNTTQFLELKARGRFGAVWRAQCGSRIVAVKTFSIQEKDSWESELEIYGLQNIKHPNVLEFLGAEIRGEGLQREFWILSTYHPEGSLCDFLKSHTVTLEELTKIVRGFTAGLNHLHDDLYSGHGSTGNNGYKPPIAHRDFKSKNVLVKSDYSVCVADFGLALVFYPNRNIGDVHGQVGTKRYMAPEVLEGAINFTRDCFLRIDMYACGLVMWEVLTRCIECYDGEPPEYRLPFEEELGVHPTLEEMQEAVVGRGLRPAIPNSAWAHPELSLYCATMEECWDADIEARLSASCVGERIAEMPRSKNGPASFAVKHPVAAPNISGGSVVPPVGGVPNHTIVNARVATNGGVGGASPNVVANVGGDGMPSAVGQTNVGVVVVPKRAAIIGGDRMSVSGDSAATASLILSSAENSGSTTSALTPAGLARPAVHLPGSSGPPPYTLRDESRPV